MQKTASRWLTTALSLGAILTVVSAPAQALKKMLLTDMGTLPNGRMNVPKRMNLDGLAVGYVQKNGGTFAGFLFDSPILYDLGVLPGRTDARNNWINRFNLVVGTSGHGNVAKGYVWSNGNMTILPDSDPNRDWPTEGIGINDAGSVVWNEDLSGIPSGGTFKDALWRTTLMQGNVPLTGTLLAMNATAISNLDWIAGVGPKDDGSVGAWIYQLPDPTNTRTPSEVTVNANPGDFASVTDMSDVSLDGSGTPSITGMTGGFVKDGNGNPTYYTPVPFITLGTTAVFPILLPGHNVGEIYGIANDGTAVGRSGLFELRNGVGLFSWTACAYLPVLPFDPFWMAFPLSDYMPTNNGITLDNVLDVNDRGQMVATYTQAGQIRSLLMTPTITPIGLTLASSSVPGGFSTTGNVVIDQNAPFGGIVVNMTTSNAIVAVPPTVNIVAGQDNVNFNVLTSPVLATTSVQVKAEKDGYSVSTTIRVQPTALDRLVITPTFITGGQKANATVFLAGRARSGGFPVVLASSNTNVAIVPASVTVPTGASQANFFVYTKAVVNNTPVQIRATANGLTRSVNMTVATPFLEILEIASNAIFGGQVASGYAQISGPAKAPGAVVTLTSSSPSVASVPASITVLTGTRVASFAVTSVRVRFNTNVTISGTFNTQTRTKTILVKGASLYSVTANPATVRGGNPATGKVTLDWYAFTGGAVVSLVSGDPSVVAIPASVTVPSTSNSVTFAITTQPVVANRIVSITGSYLGVTKVGTITLTP